MKHIVKGVAPAPELSFALQLGFLTLERGEQGSLRNPESVLAKSSWAPSDASTYPECLMGEGVSFSPLHRHPCVKRHIRALGCSDIDLGNVSFIGCYTRMHALV